jgi:hypothetical protein
MSVNRLELYGTLKFLIKRKKLIETMLASKLLSFIVCCETLSVLIILRIAKGICARNRLVAF